MTDGLRSFTLANVKFSIASNVDWRSADLFPLVEAVSIHVMLVNDLASYRKERQAVEEGDSLRMINYVTVARQVLFLSDEGALFHTYLKVLEAEADIETDLRDLRQKELTGDQWSFVYALLAMAAGHAFAATISKRYATEAGRIEQS